MLGLRPGVIAASASASASPHERLVLLDRDGTLNVDVGAPGVTDLAQLELIPGAAVAVGELKRAGCAVALVTNQSCVGKGLLSEEGLAAVHEKLINLMRDGDADAELDAVYVCLDAGPSARKKPAPGMLLEALRDFGAGAGAACYVGDTLTDMCAAAAAGVTGYMVDTGYGWRSHGAELGARLPPGADVRCVEDVADAVRCILRDGGAVKAQAAAAAAAGEVGVEARPPAGGA